MNKPEKKKFDERLGYSAKENVIGIAFYNQACDDWEKYQATLLEEIERKLPKQFNKEGLMVKGNYAEGYNQALDEAIKILREMLGCGG